MLWPKQTKEDVRNYSISHHREELLRNAKSRATKKNIPLDITANDIVITEECPYLKHPFERGTMYAASLDRIDPRLGYVKGNVEVISRKANLMKNDATTEELLEFAYSILERN